MASALFNIETGLDLGNNYGIFSGNGNSIVNAMTTSSGLYWTGNGKAISGITITASTNPPTSPPPSIGDQWYNTSNDVIYEYLYDGASYYWVDISSAVIAANNSVTAPSTVITDAIKANIGAYQTWANANIGAYQTWANGRITTLDANLGTATTRISNIVTQANANTAAYLITATGNISAGNVTVGSARLSSDRNGEIYANNFIFSGNGQSIFASFGVNSYGNVQVGEYLPHHTGALQASNVYVVYTPATTTGAAINATGKDTQGGIGYFDFLKITNTTAGATNPNKHFRVGSTGIFEIINSAYTSSLFSLNESGVLSTGQLQINGKKAVNGPAFRAYNNDNQSITSGSLQKVTFTVENFDTDGCFASSTFTPTVEGYYQFNSTVRLSGGSSTGEVMLVLYKNGAEYARGTNESGTEQGSSFYSQQVSDIAYANGSTDYFEIYIQQTSGTSKTVTSASSISYFSGCMIRGA